MPRPDTTDGCLNAACEAPIHTTIDPETTKATTAETIAEVRQVAADQRRRRTASRRLPAMYCGHADPLDCIADRPVRKWQCDQCLTFDVGERERLTTCWESERCPLAGALVGGQAVAREARS